MEDRGGSTFVGRHRELDVLAATLARVEAGHGAVALISGEPGIGKSCLADEFATRARATGARVLWGRCWEAGGAPAYWPWAQALRGTVRERSTRDVAEHVGDGLPYLAQMIPELRAGATDTVEPVADPETARFRLFDAVASYVRYLGDDHPVVIVLEDLHGADTPTLLLLQFLAHELDGARVLVVATYRTSEMVRDHPLRGVVTELARVPGTRRLALAGMGVDEIATYVEQVTGTSPDPGVVDELRDRTEGNPLFVGEIVRLVSATGATDAVAFAGAVPEGVQEAITQRLAGLDARCRELLSAASVLGRDVRLEALAQLVEHDATAVFEQLESAFATGLLATGTSPSELRFSHALVRDVLYETLPLATRARLHFRTGEVLEALYAHELESHASELAHHYLAAGPAGDIGRAVHAATVAGEVAARALAHEEAARLLRAANDLADLHDLDDGRAERLLALGEAEMRAGDLEHARGHLLRAATLAEADGRAALLARAAVAYGGRFAWERAGNDHEMVPLLQRALDAIGPEDSPLRVRLLARLAGARRDEHDREPRVAAGSEALAIARRLDDPPTLAYALNGMHGAIWDAENCEERLAFADEVRVVAQRIGDPEELIMAHAARCWALWELGDFAAARREHEAVSSLVTRLRQPAQRWLHAAIAAAIALFEGRFDEVEPLADIARREGIGSLRFDAEAAHLTALTMLRLEQGRGSEVARDLEAASVAYPWYPHFRLLAARVQAATGDVTGARSALRAIFADDLRAIPPNNYTLFSLVALADTVADLDDAELAARVVPHLEPYAHRVSVAPPEGSLGVLHRPLGRVLVTAGRYDEAVDRLGRALEVHERMGTPPWVAHTHADLAVALAKRGAPGDDARAEQHRARAAALGASLGIAELMAAEDVPSPAVDAPTLGDHASRSTTANVFRRDGELWSIAYEGNTFRLRDSKGLQYLAELLRRPREDVAAIDLVGGADGGRQEVLDDAARRAYRQRVEELQDDLDEAERFHDDERAARARAELDAVVAELTAATGLGGRSRSVAGEGERARQRVRKAIATALDRIEAQDAALGRHLASTVRTGYLCRYEPDPRSDVAWDV
ncbi:MAG TPA: AAA family ATPase [Acidimicrobiia bacterium]|nr:AAA family ATPase [Acidimicrobiia bacterium]